MSLSAAGYIGPRSAARTASAVPQPAGVPCTASSSRGSRAAKHSCEGCHCSPRPPTPCVRSQADGVQLGQPRPREHLQGAPSIRTGVGTVGGRPVTYTACSSAGVRISSVVTRIVRRPASVTRFVVAFVPVDLGACEHPKVIVRITEGMARRSRVPPNVSNGSFSVKLLVSASFPNYHR